MNFLRISKSRRTILRHANHAAVQAIESASYDGCLRNSSCPAPMDYQYDGDDDFCDTDCNFFSSLTSVGDEINAEAAVNYCQEYDHAAVPNIEPDLEDELDFRHDNRWLVDSDTDSDNDGDSDDFLDRLKQGLAEWAVLYKIQHVAVGGLLNVLSEFFPSLPRDPRTLLKTPQHYVIKNVGGGQYSHVGLSKGLSNIVNKDVSAAKGLELQINVDGIPLFKSTNISLWPILCSVNNSVDKEPFLVGLFCGKEKPSNAREFLSDFVAEASHLLAYGLVVGSTKIPVAIHSFICDAPARAFMKGIKSHSGYSSCEKCTVTGEYFGKVVFISTSAPLSPKTRKRDYYIFLGYIWISADTFLAYIPNQYDLPIVF